MISGVGGWGFSSCKSMSSHLSVEYVFCYHNTLINNNQYTSDGVFIRVTGALLTSCVIEKSEG